MKTLLIFNPNAGNGRAAKQLPAIRSRLDELQIEVDEFVTEYSGHAVEYVTGTDLSRYSAVLAAGGDGTLYEVINGYYRNSPQGWPPIGIIPTGTGNAFIRDMDLKDPDWATALDVVASGHLRSVDVGRFSTQGEDWYFLNILGLGFVADVGATAKKLKILGNLSYTLGVFYRMIFLAPFDVKITSDQGVIEDQQIFIEISNTRYTSNFLMAPSAVVDDGLLDVTLLSKSSRRRLVTSFPKILTGEHIHMPEVRTFKTSSLTVETDQPKILTPDGELMGSSPIQVNCLPRAVDIFWPSQ